MQIEYFSILSFAKHTKDLGTENIRSLLLKQSIPASIGLLSIVLYTVIDTIFVGRWVGNLGIAAITVVMPLSFLVAAIGMGLGIGGASMISRAFGAGDEEKAYLTFGNLITLVSSISLVLLIAGFVFDTELITLFGGRGDILPLAQPYFLITLAGIPFLTWAMMSNAVIRSEGAAKMAMMTMVIPGVVNIVLDPIFIYYLDWGMEGAAWATFAGYLSSGVYTAWYFLTGRSSVKFKWPNLKLKWTIVKEAFSLGATTFARQSMISLLAITINNTLFNYGGEQMITVYGILSRTMSFMYIPVFGLVQGSLPIIGFNYGAKQESRVKETLRLSLVTGTVICLFIFSMIYLFANQLASLFTKDQEVVNIAGRAMRIMFIATPVVAIQSLGASFFQAIGKALPAFLLTLTRQGIFLIPLIILLPPKYEVDGVWSSFPISDVLALMVTILFLWYQLKKIFPKQPKENEALT